MKKGFLKATLAAWAVAAGGVGMLIANQGVEAEQPGDLSRYVLTQPKLLFSLPYGENPSQVGLFLGGPEEGLASGPSDFAIGRDGTIYVGDERNGKVKRFSRSGELLMQTEGRIDRIAGMSVDGRGRIYVIHGSASNEVAVYDDKGKRVPDLEEKINTLTEQLAQREPKLKTSFRRPGAGAVQVDASGNVYLIGGRNIIKLDPEFTQAELVTQRPLDKRGYGYSYRLLPSQQEEEESVYGVDGSLVNRFPVGVFDRLEITIYCPDGSVARRFTLPRGDFSEAEKLVPDGAGYATSDERGHFYTQRDPLTIRHIQLRPNNPQFFVVQYYGVFEYDGEGNFVGVRAVINGFTMPSDWFKADPQGNVYWLDFKADHVDVMMAPVR